eukprot:comp17027_c1_seq1/m.15718 comp17027_c1_seq1/g.15718  ORF comp17027_c1_seq1/g.15718 comp17027_c1_seq1/m.15718 type:complete len:298 (-) comp17027_c1_seq1:38-931(-)
MAAMEEGEQRVDQVAQQLEDFEISDYLRYLISTDRIFRVAAIKGRWDVEEQISQVSAELHTLGIPTLGTLSFFGEEQWVWFMQRAYERELPLGLVLALKKSAEGLRENPSQLHRYPPLQLATAKKKKNPTPAPDSSEKTTDKRKSKGREIETIGDVLTFVEEVNVLKNGFPKVRVVELCRWAGSCQSAYSAGTRYIKWAREEAEKLGVTVVEFLDSRRSVKKDEDQVYRQLRYCKPLNQTEDTENPPSSDEITNSAQKRQHEDGERKGSGKRGRPPGVGSGKAKVVEGETHEDVFEQ